MLVSLGGQIRVKEGEMRCMWCLRALIMKVIMLRELEKPCSHCKGQEL